MGDNGTKPGLSVAFFGPKGSGKTTAIADLCQRLGGFEEAQHQICKDLAPEFGRRSQQHAWMLDTLAEERERGATIAWSLGVFETGSFRYTAVDTPGSPGLVNNMLRVLSLTDIAALVVSAAEGEFEAGLDSGYIKETALACFTMGIKNVVVLVTKMDLMSVQYSATRFDEIKKSVNGILKEVGYKQKDPLFVPISGTLGDNLVTKSSETSWYSGANVIDALDSLAPGVNRPAEKPLRLPVLKAYDVKSAGGATIMGRVEAGSIRAGISVTFSPSGKTAKVKSVQVDGKTVNEAGVGVVVGVALGGIRCADLRRGMVASSASNDTAAAAETFVAQVVVLDHPGAIREGYCPAIAIHTAQVPCEFEELLSKIDRKTGKEIEAGPLEARTGEVITARLRPRGQVCVEAFAAYPSLGRFAIRDHNRTIAVGVVKEVSKRPVPTASGGDESDDD